MKKAILGKKLGMTQIFSNDGLVVPVTVVEAGPCFVTQIKNEDKDGYDAVQVAFEEKREKLVNKPELGVFKKADITPKRYLKEFKYDNVDTFKIGQKIDCSLFEEGDLVDVTGMTKGRGFTGSIKRWNFHMIRASHGTGPIRRKGGSVGSNTFPAKVFKGKHMSGRYGNEQVTIQNLKVIKVDADRNVLLIKGAIPGNRGQVLTIKEAVKAAK